VTLKPIAHQNPSAHEFLETAANRSLFETERLLQRLNARENVPTLVVGMNRERDRQWAQTAF
jgi:hypothetical protein